MTMATTNEKLSELITALERGDEITPELRRWLRLALDDLWLYHVIEEKQRQRGTPVAAKTWLAARITRRLVDDYGVSVKEAAWAAKPDADQKEHDAIKRASQKVKSGKTPFPFRELHQSLVEEAADRINQDRLMNAITLKLKREKIGNK